MSGTCCSIDSMFAGSWWVAVGCLLVGTPPVLSVLVGNNTVVPLVVMLKTENEEPGEAK